MEELYMEDEQNEHSMIGDGLMDRMIIDRGCMEGYIDGYMDGGFNRSMDRWWEGEMDRGMHKQVNGQILTLEFLCSRK